VGSGGEGGETGKRRTLGSGGIGYISSKFPLGTSPISHTCQLIYALTSSAILRCPFADNCYERSPTTIFSSNKEKRILAG
jgi:hypothetical protein